MTYPVHKNSDESKRTMLWTINPFWPTAIGIGLLFFLIWGCNSLVYYFHTRHYFALVDAVEHDDYQRAKTELESGADPNMVPYPVTTEDQFSPPLSIAAVHGNIAMVTLLLDHKADPNLWDGKPYDVLASAISEDQLKVVKFLITRSGGHIDDGMLAFAVFYNAPRTAQYFLDHGANPNGSVRDNYNKSMLATAKEKGYTQIVAILKKAGAK